MAPTGTKSAQHRSSHYDIDKNRRKIKRNARKISSHDVAVVQQHAINVLDLLRDEYETHLRIKWVPAINDVLAAHADAISNVKKTLDEVRKAKAAAAKLRAELAMFALSLVTGGAMRFISGAFQHKVYPKLAGKLKSTRISVSGIAFPDMKNMGKVFAEPMVVAGTGVITSLEYNKLVASLFGGAIGDTGNFLIEKGINRLGNRRPRRNVPNFAVDLPLDLSSEAAIWNLKRAFENTLDKHVVKGTSGISALKESYVVNDKSNEYGKQQLAKANGDIVEAKRLVEKDLMEKMQEWKEAWLYYGHEPNLLPQTALIRSIETEIWALWIEENFAIRSTLCTSTRGITTKKCRGGEIIGKKHTQYHPFTDGESSFWNANVVSDIIHPIVTKRLGHLGIAHPQSPTQVVRRTIEKHRRLLEGRPAQHHPEVDVFGQISEKKKLEALLRWARTHKPTLVSNPRMPMKVRTLPKIGRLFPQ